MALRGREGAPRREVVLPFLERVDGAPFLGGAAGVDDLLEEREGEGDGAVDVCALAGVVGQELGQVGEGAVLGFGGVLQNGEALGRSVDAAEAFAGGRKGEDVGNRGTGKEDVGYNLGGEFV